MFRSEKQKEYWHNADRRWNVKTGATRSGKTYMDYFLIPKRLKAVSGKAGLNIILGNTRETARRNIIIPMQEMYGINRVSNIRYDNSCIMFGEKVFVMGADKVSHVDAIRGIGVKYCYGDEVTTWNEEVFDMLKSRLDKPYSMFDGTCNPASPLHWFKKFLDSDAEIYQQKYCIDDNPFLPQSFIDNLKKEYAGTVYYGRYIEGNWVLAEGLCYPRYEDAIVDEIPDTPAEEYCISLDYGIENPFAGLMWERHGQVWYAVDELYYSGRDTGIQKTDGDYLYMLKEFADPALQNTKPQRSIFGGATFAPSIDVIIDPSAASMIALLQRDPSFTVISANNAVDEGIHNVNLAIQRGIIKISRRCVNYIREAGSYVWDTKTGMDGREKPKKENDHLCDAKRYFVQTKGLIHADYTYEGIFNTRR